MKTNFTLFKTLAIALLLGAFVLPAESWGQTTFNGTGGSIAPNSVECFQLPAMNSNLPLDSVNGIASVCVDLTANRIQNIEMYLYSPTGAYSLLIFAGAGSGNVNGTLCFQDDALLPYSGGSGGVYTPTLELGNINHGATGTGVWELCVINTSGPAATINSWGFTLGGPNVAQPMIQMGNHGCMVETDGMDLYDSGGLTYFYGNNETYINTVCPPVDGMCMQATMTWDIETNFDNLDVYDGDSIAAVNYIGTGTGVGSAVIQSVLGCLSFVFTSDGSVTGPGYDIGLSCVPCAATVASNRPPNDDCVAAIPLSGVSGNHNATGCDIAGPNPYGTDTCSWISTENSVFYTFEITPFTPQPVEITLTNVNCAGGANQLQCALYDNDCSSVGVFGSNFHGCASGLGTVILQSSTPSLSPGTYIFVVDGNAGSECDWAVQSVVLAVDWMDFTADFLVESSEVQLNWITSNESNNEGFWVQRSRDLQGWTSLDFVPANDGVDNLHRYAYTDVDAQEAGVVHYRLKQMDKDGKAHYSNTVSVNIGQVQEPAVIRAFPNPVSDLWTLEFAIPEGQAVNLQVFDQKGKMVYQQAGQELEMGLHSFSIALEDWAPGLYFYQIDMGTETQSGKLVKS